MYEEGGKFIGHRILPVSAIRPGKPLSPLKQTLRSEKKRQIQIPTTVDHHQPCRFIQSENLNNIFQF